MYKMLFVLLRLHARCHYSLAVRTQSRDTVYVQDFVVSSAFSDLGTCQH